MEQPKPRDNSHLVRCLDCGTVYRLSLDLQEADPCPQCGGVGWIEPAALRRIDQETSS